MKKNTPISFEFFPPKTAAGKEKLLAVHEKLSHYQPDFFSVTYGAGGSTRNNTQECVLNFNQQGTSTAPHLTCIGDSSEDLLELLNKYKLANVKRIVTLRGDLPAEQTLALKQGSFRYANELVLFIREHFDRQFHLSVAAYPETHPQSQDAQQDLFYFKQKVDAGADSAITQYFYNPDAYFNFVERCQKNNINIPIIPGIMPITNYEKLARFSALCGAEIPRWIAKQLLAYQDDMASLTDFGTEVVSRLCETLLAQGAPGLHFYTLNQSSPSVRVLQQLGLQEANKTVKSTTPA